MTSTDLSPVLQRLEALTAQVAALSERQRARDELFSEMAPVARAALGDAITRLDALEQKGYFAFADEVVKVGQRIVEGFSPEDVRQLGDAVVSILETVRALTQPAALQVMADASSALVDADGVKPVGIIGMVRATRNDDVQKGIAMLLEVLRRVGHGVNGVATRQLEAADRKEKLAQLLGPRRDRTPPPRLPAGPPVRAAAPAAPPRCASPRPPAPGEDAIDPASWDRAAGERLAAAEQIELTPAHWAIVDAARADFAATQASPNIRRLTQVTQVTTRDLYTLFPRAPARTIARIAGLPRPAGCL